jgi:peptidoglycan/xylan/chitin deacetylase (PgdA/CDA1 family)
VSASEKHLEQLDRVVGATAMRFRRSVSGLVVLFHRVGPAAPLADSHVLPQPAFESSLAFLKDHFTITTLREFVDRRDTGRSVRGLCAITFDDGYRDFLTHALPALERIGVPATHFLVSQCVRTGQPTWNFRLNCLEPVLGPPPTTTWKELLGRMPRGERHAWLDEREAVLGLPPHVPMLSEADVAALDPHPLLHWGSHTRTHDNLASARSADVDDELVESRRYLEPLCSGFLPYIAYPNGSYSRAVGSAAMGAGYRAGFRVGQRAVRRTDDGLAFPRVDITALSSERLRLEVSGAVPALRQLRKLVRR